MEHLTQTMMNVKKIRLNFNHLHIFYVVAQSGSFSKASKELGLHQPTVTHQVRVLEMYFGTPLFERVGRGKKLTTVGLLAYEDCKTIFGVVERLRDLKRKLEP